MILGKWELPPYAMLAPMAGVSDRALRELAISGTLWDKPMGFDLRLPEAAQPFAAFILLGFMAAFLQWIKAGVSHFFQRKEEESR